eukprot:15461920-Alexandrium_andersonii.AAC.1
MLRFVLPSQDLKRSRSRFWLCFPHDPQRRKSRMSGLVAPDASAFATVSYACATPNDPRPMLMSAWSTIALIPASGLEGLEELAGGSSAGRESGRAGERVCARMRSRARHACKSKCAFTWTP